MTRGFTVHELIISLTIMSAVFVVATHFALEQARFFRAVTDVSTLRWQLEQATNVLRNTLWSVSPRAGDILVAQDSALEIRLATGTAVSCEGVPGTVLIPAPTVVGNTLSAFMRRPERGDRVSALFSDSLGATWLHLRVMSAPEPAGVCSMFPAAPGAWAVATVEPLALPAGTPLRFTRPLRLSLYRSTDNRWYLGARDWNGEREQFNTIQPVAGPLGEHTADTESGLRFAYHDRDGAVLLEPVDGTRVSSVTVVARASTHRPVRMRGLRRADGIYRDSGVAVIRLRNVR